MFVSTTGGGGRYSLAEALRLGPAPDGGLLMPESIQPLPKAALAHLGAQSLPEQALLVLTPLLGGVPNLEGLVADALDFPIPLVEVASGMKVLEIFHGPTHAFKDVGARFLARLLAATGSNRESTVLVATSGDTGGAVAQAFHGVADTRVAILYPRGQVSEVQERQFTTLGGNIRAFGVEGAFDDCQQLVKEAFADRELSDELGLTSANSINVGRLLPQIVYYFHAASQLGTDEEILFVTPSGNFGNLTAGLMARRLGLNCRFMAATNLNDAVPAYLESGNFVPRASLRTISNAMDVGHPNNFTRILHLYGGDHQAIRQDIQGASFDDEATRSAIRRVVEDHGYLLDPHTAVGWLALEQLRSANPDDRSQGIVLGTAHPAKFGEVVAPVIGREVELPPNLAQHMEKEIFSEPLANDFDELRAALRSW